MIILFLFIPMFMIIVGLLYKIKHQRATIETFGLALAGGQNGLWDWNVKTNKVRRNQDYNKLLGIKGEQLGDRIIIHGNTVHPEDLQKLKDELAAHLQGKSKQFEVEYRVLNESGDWTWLLDRGRVITRDLKGRPQRI